MPIFVYSCTNCDEEEEIIEQYEDEEKLHICPKCGEKMERCFVGTSHFKLIYDPKKDKVSWGDQGYASTQRYAEHDKQAKGDAFVTVPESLK